MISIRPDILCERLFKPLIDRFLGGFMLCVLITLLLPFSAHAKVLEPLVLTNKFESGDLSSHSLVQHDPTGQITPELIQSTQAQILKGKTGLSDIIPLGSEGGKIWVIAKLKSQSDTERWIVDLGGLYDGRKGILSDIKPYEMTSDAAGNFKITELKHNISYDSFPIHLKKGEEKFLLISFISADRINAVLPLRIYSPSAYLEHRQNRAGSIAILQFSLIGFFCFFFLRSIVKREKDPVFMALYYAALYGIFYLQVWNNEDTLPFLQQMTVLGTPYALGMAATILAYSINEKKELRYESTDVTRYFYLTLIVFNLCMMFLFFILPSKQNIAFHLSNITPVATLISLGLLSNLRYWAQGWNKQLFGFSFFAVAMGYTISICPDYGFGSYNGFVLNSLWITLLIQGLCFSFTLQDGLASAQNKSFSAYKNAAKDQTGTALNLDKMRSAKDSADYARLMKVIEKEREALTEFQAKETTRIKEMEKAKEAADEANRAKSAFLAVVSHEIRTPMTGVMGMVKMLLSTSLSKQQHDYALTIQESSEAMLGLLNDILDFEKIQRGKIDIEHISFDLHRTIHGVMNLMSGHAASKNITLKLDMGAKIPRFVKGDPTRLRQVLLNLMGNAIKFTEKGGVTFHVKNIQGGQQSKFAQHHSIYFGVQDTGIGIPADAQKNLFNPFAQADVSVARKFGGSGLGLAISKGLIEKMNSSINISSQPGEGSTFFFTLQMERGIAPVSTQTEDYKDETVHASPIEPEPQIKTEQANALRLLIVDDNDITRKVLSAYLEDTPHQVSFAQSAEQALKMIDEAPFDAVFMDIELPGMRGNEAVRILRQSENPYHQTLKVYATTGNVDSDHIAQYMQDGMSGTLLKPIERSQLLTILQGISPTPHNDIEEHSQQESVSFENSTLLNLDDLDLDEPLPELSIFENPAEPEATHPAGAAQNEYDPSVFNQALLKSLKNALGQDAMKDLLHDLIVKMDEILDQIAESRRAKSTQDLAARTHELKGMTGNFGLVEVASLSARAEQILKSGALSPELEDILDALPAASERGKAMISEWASR